MRARLLVVMKIASQSPPQRRLVPHNDVIQALASNRPDQPFHIWILPRRSRRRDHFFDPHALRDGNEFFAENRISIPDPMETLLESAAPSTLIAAVYFQDAEHHDSRSAAES